jgi:hypothetical protein
MNDTAKKEFKKLSKKEKFDYIQDLLDRKTSLNDYEFEAATKKQKEESIQLKIDRAGWLETYEFKDATKLQMEKYILRKRFLSAEEFQALPDDLKKYYLEQGSYTQISFTNKEFNRLSDDFKKYYVNFAFDYPLKFSITPEMAGYLSDNKQIKFIDFLFEKGIGLSSSELKNFSSKAQKYHKEKKKEIMEVRAIVKRIISENLLDK